MKRSFSLVDFYPLCAHLESCVFPSCEIRSCLKAERIVGCPTRTTIKWCHFFVYRSHCNYLRAQRAACFCSVNDLLTAAHTKPIWRRDGHIRYGVALRWSSPFLDSSFTHRSTLALRSGRLDRFIWVHAGDLPMARSGIKENKGTYKFIPSPCYSERAETVDGRQPIS
jgi:hypothetical protein